VASNLISSTRKKRATSFSRQAGKLTITRLSGVIIGTGERKMSNFF
jgi:hypothetical protein